MRTPRIRYLRYRNFDRVRYSEFLLEWLAAQGVRLSGSTPGSVTESDVFELLRGGSAAAVEALPDGA